MLANLHAVLPLYCRYATEHIPNSNDCSNKAPPPSIPHTFQTEGLRKKDTNYPLFTFLHGLKAWLNLTAGSQFVSRPGKVCVCVPEHQLGGGVFQHKTLLRSWCQHDLCIPMPNHAQDWLSFRQRSRWELCRRFISDGQSTLLSLDLQGLIQGGTHRRGGSLDRVLRTWGAFCEHKRHTVKTYFPLANI